MYYICVENDNVVSILNYQPNVPASVTVHTITDQEYADISANRKIFNTATARVEDIPASVQAAKDREIEILNNKNYLNNTDWQVLRHVRELALGITTTLTPEEYIALETDRQAAAKSI